MSDRFCVDCAHYTYLVGGPILEAMHNCERRGATTDLVTGRRIHKNNIMCSDERLDVEGRCGIAAVFFKPKEDC